MRREKKCVNRVLHQPHEQDNGKNLLQNALLPQFNLTKKIATRAPSRVAKRDQTRPEYKANVVESRWNIWR